MSKRKNRLIKEKEYNDKYSEIPKDLPSRLNYMCELYNVSESKYDEILTKKQNLLENMEYYDLFVVLYEIPEGTPRSRFRIINRANLANAAIENSNFVHVYSPNASDDQRFMKRLMGEELIQLNNLIYTPCIIEIDAYFETPKSFNIVDKFMAEIGLFRKWIKPDWDNIGKKYSDMYNTNVWLDDAFVIDGRVRKFYSILPRLEIKLRYLNGLYNRNHFNSINNRKDIEKINEMSYFDRNGNITTEDLGGYK